jgi:hypothetical protein
MAYYHIGGFVRSGEGPRSAGYNASQGGNLKLTSLKNLNQDIHALSF